jgi:methionyl-tRNA formyltransferase
VKRPATPPAGTLLFGNDSPYAAAVFRELVHRGVALAAVVVDGAHHARPIVAVSAHGQRETLASLAASQGLPLRGSPDVADPELARWATAFAPDFILVACFEQRLPQALCAVPRHATLNLHPSLLPRYRGPTPLFWQLRHGEPVIGVTLHHVAREIDAGDIVAQADCPLADGLDGVAIDERLGRAGARLFAATCERYRDGTVETRAQVAAEASYFGPPTAEDFRVSSDWSARRLFNFIRGTDRWGRPYPITLDGREYLLGQALAYSADGTLASPFELSGERIRIRCAPGVLEATLWGEGTWTGVSPKRAG